MMINLGVETLADCLIISLTGVLIVYLFTSYLNSNTTGCIKLKERRKKMLERINLKYFGRCR